MVLRKNEKSDSYPLNNDNNDNDNSKVLRKFLNEKLAHYKHPRHVVVVEELPRNHMGKINKKSLLKDLNISF